jgi:hypothetical protein
MNQLEPSWAEGYPGGLAGVGWPQLATYPQSPFFRAGVLLRRSVPVPGILATHRPGAIMDKSERQFVVRYSSKMTESKHELKQ